MAKKEVRLDEVVDEALSNAREDREKSLEAFDKMKDSLDPADMQAAMLIGDKAVKLLEQLTRSNEQIVRVAQILQRKEEKEKEKKREFLDLGNLEEEEEIETSSDTPKVRVVDE